MELMLAQLADEGRDIADVTDEELDAMMQAAVADLKIAIMAALPVEGHA